MAATGESGANWLDRGLRRSIVDAFSFNPWGEARFDYDHVTFFTTAHGVGTLGQLSKLSATVQDCQECQTESDYAETCSNLRNVGAMFWINNQTHKDGLPSQTGRFCAKIQDGGGKLCCWFCHSCVIGQA
jgi:hypothetical protein